MSDNPYENSQPLASNEPSDVPAPTSTTGRLFKLVIVASVLAILVVLFVIPVARRVALEPPRRTQCFNNLKNISLALHNYHVAHGEFPPAYTVDENGRRLHSWRTLILPWLDQQALLDSIDLDKPWDHPVNSAARKTLLVFYQCPSAGLDAGFTTYQGVVGVTAFFHPSGEPRSLEDFTDDPGKTIMLTDVPPEQAVHWMDPGDGAALAYLTGLPAEAETVHQRAVSIAMADGSVKAWSTGKDPADLAKLLTINGGEETGSID